MRMSALPFHEKAGPCQLYFLCLASPRWQKSLAGEEHVKAERSEFILSLDGGRAGIIEDASGRNKT
jgi:hypothetical protein